MKKLIAVIFGGKSSEHEISIITGLQALKAINKTKYNVVPIYISKEGKFYSGEPLEKIKNYKNDITKIKKVFEVGFLSGSNFLHKKIKNKFKRWLKVDCALLTLHGMNGEDGSLQGQLELCSIQYTSSGIVSCGLCMDKVLTKRVLESLKMPILPWFYVERDSYDIKKVDEKIVNSFNYPIVVKPANLGSSIGIDVCQNKKELLEGLKVASQYDKKIIIEKYVKKLKEVNVSVLGFKKDIKVSALEEPVNYKEFLSFDDKYKNAKHQKGLASLKRKLPANVTKAQKDKITNLAKQIFYEFDCAGVVRIDFIIDKSVNKVYVNEINTIPGSLAFYLWEHESLYFTVLIDKLIELAFKKHKEKIKNKYSYVSGVLIDFDFNNPKGKK